MASPASVVRACLVQAGLVILARDRNLVPIDELPGENVTPCFVPSMPSSPARAVAIRNAPGVNFGKAAGGKAMTHPGVSILVRDVEEDDAHALAAAIADAIDRSKMGEVEVGGVTHYVHSLYRVGTLVSLGEDTLTQRQQFVISARVAFRDQEPTMG